MNSSVTSNSQSEQAAPLVLTSPKYRPALERILYQLARSALIRKRRTIRQFAEDEIVLPTGPHQDERFRVARQPWFGPWFDALDFGAWRRYFLTGIGQGGKTVGGSVLPTMWHLFEWQETVVYGGPTLDIAADKYQQDILPMIEKTQYRELLPTTGSGSRGGKAPVAVQYRHGPTLRFMTGGGGDKVRASFTTRVAVVTEVDGMDEAGGASRETDKVSQIEARTNAFGDRARFYGECTLSTKEGRTNKEIQNGTASRLALPCPHCHAFVTPEREHFRGWQDAETVIEAGERATLFCPACGVIWSEPDRFTANGGCKLVHKGQDILPDGTITGLMPRTDTLGFRFTCVNNLIVPMERIAKKEWSAPRQTKPDLAEKELRQFFWALCSEAETIELTDMNARGIADRTIDIPRGRVPADTVKLTVAVDVHKWHLHWDAIAWRPDGSPHVVEYGVVNVPSKDMAEELAILTTLRGFRDDVCMNGWPSIDAKLGNIRPSLVLIDSGYKENVVVAFCNESTPAGMFLPCKGFGEQQIPSKRPLMINPGYEAVIQPLGHKLVEVNADVWKTFVHDRLQTPVGQPGGLTLFKGEANDHLGYAHQLLAEKKVEDFIAGRGVVTRWERMQRKNHFFDATAMACVAGHGVGIRLAGTVAVPPPPPAAEVSKPPTAPNPLNYRGKW